MEDDAHLKKSYNFAYEILVSRFDSIDCATMNWNDNLNGNYNCKNDKSCMEIFFDIQWNAIFHSNHDF